MEAKINSLYPFVMLDFVFCLSAMTVSSYVFRSDRNEEKCRFETSVSSSFGKMSVSVLPQTNRSKVNFNCCCSENLVSLSFFAKNYFRDTVAYLEDY